MNRLITRLSIWILNKNCNVVDTYRISFKRYGWVVINSFDGNVLATSRNLKKTGACSARLHDIILFIAGNHVIFFYSTVLRSVTITLVARL